MLRSIKSEIVARNIAANQVTADNANLAVVNLWRQVGSTPTDFDAWIDDNLTGQARTGFELLPTTSGLQLSLEVATILLGSLPSNLRFSLVDYDAAQTAADALGGPKTTAVGFAIWKQVVALDETAISYVLDGVNNDVALVSDYLTRDQLMAVRDYIISWAGSSVVQRDRQRFWRKAFAKRTTNSDLRDPDVDLDLEHLGVQSGFSLQPLSSSSSVAPVSVATANLLWNASIEYAFVHPAGFTKWLGIVDGVTTGVSSGLLAGVPGMTGAEVNAISAWIKGLLDDGFVRRRALLHWTSGTCVTSLQLPRDGGCLRYDLEPNIDGQQTGFEMNPDAVFEIGSGISESARNALWDVAQGTVSFLMPAHPSDTTKYYARWLQAIRTSNYPRLISESQQLKTLAVSEVSARAIGTWLQGWTQNDLNKLAVYYWWLRSTCWPREENSPTQVSSQSVATGQATCREAPNENEQSTIPTPANVSPFFTDTRTYDVTKDTCPPTGPQFTRSRQTYTLTARVFSCDTVSTGLADDLDDGTRGFELEPLEKDPASRISLAAAIVLWDSESKRSFRNIQGYKSWIDLAAHISGSAAGLSAEIQAAVADVNAAIVSLCQTGIYGGGPGSGIFNETMSDTSCSQVTSIHITQIASWVNEQSGSTWVKNTMLDQWRRGVAGGLDIEPYRDGLQSGLELTTGCKAILNTLTKDECLSITNEGGTKYEVPREALKLWDASNGASFLTTQGYALWDALALAVESGDATSIQASQTVLAKLCASTGASSTWEVWMERVFQWLQQWKTNEHLERDVLGHWLYARCPTTPTITKEQPPTVQTSIVSSCTKSYSATFSPSLHSIQQLASRPTTFFDADVVQDAALVQPSETVSVYEDWTLCEPLEPTGFKKTVGTRQSKKEYQACNLLSVLATPDLYPSEVTHLDATFELNCSIPPSVSIEIAQEIMGSQSAFSLLDSTAFFDKWYPAIDRSTALQTVQDDLNALATSASPSDLSAVQDYLKQWESSNAAADSVASSWISTNAAQVDVDIHEDGDQPGFELYTSASYKGTTNAPTLPTLEQTKSLWKADSVYSIVRSDSTVDDAGLPTGFRAWEEMYSGVDYESEHLVSQYPLKGQVARATSMSHALSSEKQALLLAAMTAATALTEAQIRAIARWLFNWAIDDSLRDFVLAQWATGETFRGNSKLILDFSSHLGRLYSFTVTSDMNPDYFTLAPPALIGVSRESLRKLWDIASTGSLLDPASRIVWCMVSVVDSEKNSKAPCAHLLDGYGILLDAAFNEFVTLVQPTIPNSPILQATADFSTLALGFLKQALQMTSEQIQAVAQWYRGVPYSSLFFQVYQLDEWSAAPVKPSQDPLQFGYELAFVLPWNTVVARSVSTSDLVANVAYLEVSKTKKTIGECTKSLSLLLTLWDASNTASFINPTGMATWLSFARGESDESDIIGTANPTAKVIVDQQLAGTTVSCLFQLIGHWMESWSNHPNARMFVEEFWIAPISQGSASAAQFLPSATDLAKTFPLNELDLETQKESKLFSTTDWWVSTARILLDVEESTALVNPNEGFALWKPLLTACFSSDRKTGKCQTPDMPSNTDINKEQALSVLSRHLVDRVVAISTTLSTTSDKILQAYTASMISSQITPWLITLLDHTTLEQYIIKHVRMAISDTDIATEPLSFVDLAAIQFVDGSVTAVNYTVLDTSTGRLMLDDNGTRSERYPRSEFVFDAAQSSTVEQTTSFSPGFGELGIFCSQSGKDRRFAYDEDVTCSLGTEYIISITEAMALWTAFGLSDTTVWKWPKRSVPDSVIESGVPPPSALPDTFRTALLLDAFLGQPFATTSECEAQILIMIEAYDSEWGDQEKQQVCVDRSGEIGVGAKTVYLQLPGLEALDSKPVSAVHDVQAYLRYAATKFVYEPQTLGMTPSPPQEKAPSSPLSYPIGGYFAASTVSQVLFASPPSEAGASPKSTPLWSNTTTTERGASTFESLLPLKDDVALYRNSKSVMGRLLAVDSTTLMNAWGEDVQLSAVRVTDGSQFTTAVLTGQGENTLNSVHFPPEKLYFYWGYARRVAQITFDTNTTRFGVSLMRYVVDWSLPSRLPTGIVASDSAPTSPSLNMSFLNDDLPLVVQSSSSPDSKAPVFDVDPQTGAVLHRRLVWQLTAQVGDTAEHQVLNVWHRDLAAGWLPVVWIEEEAGISVTASASMTNLGPFSAKTLFVLGIIGGSCAIAAGCVVAYISIRRARMMRMQRFHAIVPEASAAAAVVNGEGDDALKSPRAEEDTKGGGVDAATAMQTMLDHTEGIDGEVAGGADEIRTEETTRAWLHRAAGQ
ncbi:unnamed protein product [Phytophthora fragariaefolia]|uniref:Unnamed protein product n=1 Tax=Phytophthora fragariaefolia TaxID=1490495 RepID=A0A9W7CT50_9STRA|nr:unnamed protein product [Phytophthora fragariaefolia]